MVIDSRCFVLFEALISIVTVEKGTNHEAHSL
jgi:hypothetical protein